MKNFKYGWALLLTLAIQLPAVPADAQAEEPAAKELVRLHYFNRNNNLQYLVLENLLKKGRELTPLAGKNFKLYLDEYSPENLIAGGTTGNNGTIKFVLPPVLKNRWEASSTHSFLAVAGNDTAVIADLAITKAKLVIDTAASENGHQLVIQLRKLADGEWKPAAGGEIKAGIIRQGSILPAGEEESYTTDSSGNVTVAFNRNNLPGDAKGNIILASKIEENDEFGNLYAELSVPWGAAVKMDNTFFDQRALWSTRYRTPIWLLSMVYAIVIAVWGTIAYLIVLLVKINKLGKNSG